jgi:hypothetical protein
MSNSVQHLEVIVLRARARVSSLLPRDQQSRRDAEDLYALAAAAATRMDNICARVYELDVVQLRNELLYSVTCC